jgi:hypothetical protein
LTAAWARRPLSGAGVLSSIDSMLAMERIILFCYSGME